MTLAQAPPALRAAALLTMRSRRDRWNGPAQVAGPFIDYLGSAVALSGPTAVVGASGVNNYAGAAYVYVRRGSRWSLQAVLTDPLNVPFDYFGTAVALVGTTALVGAKGERNGAGAVYVYTHSGTRWRMQASIADPSGRARDAFGTAIALGTTTLNGTTAVIGATGVSHSGGATYVYVRSGRHWLLRAALPDPHGHRDDFFGTSVALSAGTAIIGAWQVDNEGRAYVYLRSGTRWRLQATLSPPEDYPSSFGISVAISGATVLVGADSVTGDAGAAYVYTRLGAIWHLRATLSDPTGSRAGLFGFGSAVALSGMTAAIGACGFGTSAGATYIFVKSGNSWHRQALLTDPNHTAYDAFGGAVAITGNTTLIGANGVNQQAGASYLYVRSGSRWGRQAALTDPRGIPGKAVGAAVAIEGTTAVVGAWGVNDDAGAVYIAVRSAAGWQREATLNDPGRSHGALFGAAVALSGSTMLVGAWGTEQGLGAVYVYTKVGHRWRQQATINSPIPIFPTFFGVSVALSGSTAIIGAWNADGEAGAAYVYVRSGTRWHLQATLLDPDGKYFDSFGAAVTLSGATAVISATGVHNDAGAAYVYVRTGSHWRRQAVLSDPDGKPNDQFGTSVALSGAQAVIGAPGVRGYDGAVYMYSRTGQRWRRRAVLTVSRRASPAGGFGSAVAISGTGAAAVALLSGQSVSGLTTERHQCGFAFEFSRPTGKWRERARVADPKCRSYDEFGYAVAIYGRTAVIGAPGAVDNSGVAYLLTLLGPG